MAGFPTRPSIDALGPEMIDRARVVDPRKELDSARVNLLRWQVAGAGQVTPQAWVLAVFTEPSTIAIAAQGNAWRGASPAIERTSAGIYVITYPVSAANERGDMAPLQLLGAVVSPRGAKLGASWEITSYRVVTVTLFDKDSVETDGSFMVAVY